MPSTRDLRRRIKSVSGVRKITKAMEMISASKMRRATSLTLGSRPYSSKMWELASTIVQLSGPEKPQHPLFAKREIKHTLAIVISSDRGLAGMYDSAILKTAAHFAAQ